MATGTVTKITDAEGNTASYTYNSNYSELQRVQSQDTSVAYTYDGNRISSIAQGFGSATSYAETYSFTYDVYGNVTDTKVGDKVLSTNTYAPRDGVLTQSTYGNGDGIKYGYDYSGNITAIYVKDGSAYETTPSYEWEYSADGTPRKHIDNENDLTYAYSYDSIGRLIRTDISGSYSANTEYGYNTRGHLISVKNNVGGNLYAQYYSYSKSADEEINLDACEGLPTRYIALGKTTTYAYDGLNRLTGITTEGATADIITEYEYYASDSDDTYTTTQLATETINGVIYTYEYDKVGNITTIKVDDVLYRTYTYDALGQLTSEIRHDEGVKVKNEYNHLGNIRFRKVYDWTPTSETLVLQYTYNYSTDSDAGWNYLLTSIVTQDYINNVTTTETVDYDQIGNPTSYRGATLAFNGRQLTSYTKGSTSISYQYDASGLRSSKTVNGNTTTYQYVGDKLYFEQRADGSKMYYFYDSYGNLAKIYRHTSEGKKIYNVVTNSQGDVTAIYDFYGVLVCTYEYDAWGNLTYARNSAGNVITSQNHIAFLNPIRYRGYYFDNEIGMYYLQSRYYDPSTGRFINADGYITTGQGVLSYNMYAYCLNNPVMFSDPSGMIFIPVMPDDYLQPELVAPETEYKAESKPQNPTVVAPIDPSTPPNHPDYHPPKKWDGKKVKNPNGKGYGWPAADGGVWMPTPNMHGGEGWTVQRPGGGHSHAYPGGHVRNHFQREQSFGGSVVMVLGGFVFTGVLVLDNITGVGVADDPLLVGSIGCFAVGMDGVLGKKVCTECGEVIYGY